MRIFDVDEHRICFLRLPDKSWHPLRDINENDVLEIITLIIDGGEVEMDPVPDNEEGRDPAELIIYKELCSQFEKIIADRNDILKRIDAEFADARSYYESVDLDDNLLDPETAGL